MLIASVVFVFSEQFYNGGYKRKKNHLLNIGILLKERIVPGVPG